MASLIRLPPPRLCTEDHSSGGASSYRIKNRVRGRVRVRLRLGNEKERGSTVDNLPKRMNAVVNHGRGHFRYEPLPVPEPGPEEVLVRVLTTGICGHRNCVGAIPNPATASRTGKIFNASCARRWGSISNCTALGNALSQVWSFRTDEREDSGCPRATTSNRYSVNTCLAPVLRPEGAKKA